MGVNLILCAHVVCPRTQSNAIVHLKRNRRKKEGERKWKSAVPLFLLHCLTVSSWFLFAGMRYVAGIRTLVCKCWHNFSRIVWFPNGQMPRFMNENTLKLCAHCKMHLFDHFNGPYHVKWINHRMPLLHISNEFFSRMTCLTYIVSATKMENIPNENQIDFTLTLSLSQSSSIHPQTISIIRDFLISTLRITEAVDFN